tara:strand:- start:17 stop:118 length:102 start_codon:yes stop_codon:yes gene_type:complete
MKTQTFFLDNYQSVLIKKNLTIGSIQASKEITS